MKFIPDNMAMQPKVVPYFEDQSAIAGADLRKGLPYYQNKVGAAINRLDGIASGFIPVRSDGSPLRYGFRVMFAYSGVVGRMDVAALPIRKETTHKKEQALAQALYLFWKELDAMADAWVYRPNSVPLLPFLIGAGDRTVAEEIIAQGTLSVIRPTTMLRDGNSK